MKPLLGAGRIPGMAQALGVCVGAVALLASLPAGAQAGDELSSYRNPDEFEDFESPQNAAVELRFGPYRPRVDDEFGGSGPYAQSFGDDTRFQVGLEVDWQILRIPYFGSIGPGAGWGYTKASGNAPFADGTGVSAQDTSLWVMPMYVVGVGRVDVLAREFGIPLVPYGKVGLSYALWQAGTASGTSEVGDVEGKGSEYGWQFALGGMFLLDFLDRESAREMDLTTGINNSYFFMEWFYSDVSSFGSGMQVGANTWVLGLAFEL